MTIKCLRITYSSLGQQPINNQRHTITLFVHHFSLDSCNNTPSISYALHYLDSQVFKHKFFSVACLEPLPKHDLFSPYLNFLNCLCVFEPQMSKLNFYQVNQNFWNLSLWIRLISNICIKKCKIILLSKIFNCIKCCVFFQLIFFRSFNYFFRFLKISKF